MFTLSTLIECLELPIFSSTVAIPHCEIDSGIFFLQPDSTPSPGCIYVGTAQDAAAFLSSCPPPEFPVTLLAAGGEITPPDGWKGRLNLFCFELAKETLYNRLNHIYMHILHLHRVFSDATRAHVPLADLAQLACDHLGGAPVFLLDSGYKLLASSAPATFPVSDLSRLSAHLFSTLTENGYLEMADVLTLNRQESSADKRVFFKQVWKGDFPAYYILFLFPDQMPMTTSLRHTARQIYRELVQYFGDRPASRAFSPELHDFVCALIERRIHSPQEARARLQVLGLQSFHYIITMLVTFEDAPPVPVNYVASQLKNAIPSCILTTYEKDILLFVPANQSAEYPDFDKNVLEALLESCGAFMGIAFPVRSILSVPTEYVDARRAITFGRARHPLSPSRIFWVEDCCFDRIIDLCSHPAHKDYHNGNLGFLCHPALIALIRYDRKHHTDYVDVLDQFLRSNQNIAECARKLYVHRNTLVNKLNKIEEITGRSLNDDYLLHLLFFSLQIYTFVRDVQGADILSLDK